MHGLGDVTSAPAGTPDDHRPWFRLLNRYHWFVLAVAALGWMFDCLDQQLFVLARPAAIKDLVAKEAKNSTDPGKVERDHANGATSVFMLGWACGGLFFGVLGDRIGRARTMLLTILSYSIFTGLSALSVGFVDFVVYRFVTGLGVGGEFAVGVALVAEVMPAKARTYALGFLQALSAVGHMSAAVICLGLSMAFEARLFVVHPWRLMFVVGALPALLLAVLIWARLKEPEVWQKVSHDGAAKKKLGSYTDLFRDPVLRRHALLGLVLGCAGIIGLWSIGFFTSDLMRDVQRPREEAIVCAEYAARDEVQRLLKQAGVADVNEFMRRYNQDTKPAEADEEYLKLTAEIKGTISARLDRWSSYTSLMFNFGGVLGMYSFGILAQRLGRKRTFAMALLAAIVSTVAVFWFLSEFWQMFVLVPVMGFCQLSLFGGYAIYLPELFPTRLRSTGTSFCYSVGRSLAALGPVAKTAIESMLAGTTQPQRFAGMAMCGVYVLGLLVLPFLPETNGKPLPE